MPAFEHLGPRVAVLCNEMELNRDILLATGRVKWDVISVYIAAMGGWPVFMHLAAWFLAAEAARVGITVWLSHWTGAADKPGAPSDMHPLVRPSCYACTIYLELCAPPGGGRTCARHCVANFTGVSKT